MRHRRYGTRARDFRALRVDRHEPAGLGFAEADIERVAIGTQVKRAALHAEIVAPLWRHGHRPGVAIERVERLLVELHGPARQHRAAAEIERPGLPAFF